ncbi:MAG: sugar phosphate nucleotidyltransferase [Candidatus Odinarchaeia archaeon]
MIKKAVIPAAGLGTRLLTATKEMPKEMLPLFAKGANGNICLKPILQLIFEQLYDAGFREFCIIVGRGKRAIEDHFNVDKGFVEFLKEKKKIDHATDMESFYQKLLNSHIIFMNQPAPKGFGDAVYRAKPFTGSESFLVNAGDDLVVSKNGDHLRRLIKVFEEKNADAAFLVEEVDDPRKYVVIEGEEVEENVYHVKNIVEKPSEPVSKIAAIAVYIFRSRIYKALLKAVLKVNEEQPLKAVEAAEKHLGSLKEKKISILGLSFKPNTDDIREAPSIKIIKKLLKKNAKITVYDPKAIENVKKIFKI